MIYVRNKKTYDGDGEYIGRPSPLGNPFHMESESKRNEVIANYKKWLWTQYLDSNKEVNKELYKLYTIAQERDLNLICWCAPKACHGDVIKAYIEWIIKKGKSFTFLGESKESK